MCFAAPATRRVTRRSSTSFALEGLALFALLWWFSAKPRPAAGVGAVFLIGYGVFSLQREFGREPDGFLGYLAFGLTMGQRVVARR